MYQDELLKNTILNKIQRELIITNTYLNSLSTEQKSSYDTVQSVKPAVNVNRDERSKLKDLIKADKSIKFKLAGNLLRKEQPEFLKLDEFGTDLLVKVHNDKVTKVELMPAETRGVLRGLESSAHKYIKRQREKRGVSVEACTQTIEEPQKKDQEMQYEKVTTMNNTQTSPMSSSSIPVVRLDKPGRKDVKKFTPVLHQKRNSATSINSATEK